MSESSQTQVQPSPERSHWTASKKIIGIAIIVLFISSSYGTMLYYNRTDILPSPAISPNRNCHNGATNYPACNNNTCTNGTTNFPNCNSCNYRQNFTGSLCVTFCATGGPLQPGCIFVFSNCDSYLNESACVVKPGATIDNFKVQGISVDSVVGLLQQRWPLCCYEFNVTLHVGDSVGYPCEGKWDKLTNISYLAQTATFIHFVSSPPYGGCPICLSGSTLIDTPFGKVNIKELWVGMPIYTVDSFGHRELGTVLRVSKTAVSSIHLMVHLVLEDGRELFASPGHPLTDGRLFASLKPGDIVDGSTAMVVDLVAYNEDFTYDVLPSGDTGFYWANGILVGSTLKDSSLGSASLPALAGSSS